MWEITLVGNKHDYMYFVMLEEMILSSINEKPIVSIVQNNNLYFSIAINDRKNIKFVKKSIMEIIIKICKEEYYKDNLIHKLGSDTELNNFILLSLVSLNIQDEINYSIVKVKFSKMLHIRSLMKFRLNKLYVIWDRIIDFINYNMREKVEERLYLDFLKFIASSSISENDIMYLEQGKDSMIILDKNKKLLSSIPKNDEIGVVVNLIVLSPKKLIINCYTSLSNKIAGLIEYIFQDRISILL